MNSSSPDDEPTGPPYHEKIDDTNSSSAPSPRRFTPPSSYRALEQAVEAYNRMLAQADADAKAEAKSRARARASVSASRRAPKQHLSASERRKGRGGHDLRMLGPGRGA